MPKLMKFSLRSFLTFFAGQKHRKHRSLQVAEMRSESVVVSKRLSIVTELPVSERETHNQLSSYTSLRDLMPASRPISPIKQKRESSRTAERELEEDDPHWPGGGARPPIKNRLVEQAARAYLLPAGAQTAPSEQFFARYWAKLTSSGSLHVRPSTEDLYTPVHHDSSHLDSHFECGVSCLPSFLWDLAKSNNCWAKTQRNVMATDIGNQVIFGIHKFVDSMWKEGSSGVHTILKWKREAGQLYKNA